jgi:cobalamin biosynthesis protein CobT
MAITDLFSSSFLFSVAIIIILIGGIFAFISYRMAEQDHKINAMIGLVSTMANETQFFRSKIHTIQQQLDVANTDQLHSIHLSTNNLGEKEITKNLISVSDDEYDDDDDDDDEDEDEDEDEEDDEDEEEEDEEEEEEDEEEEEEEEEKLDDDNVEKTIKVITLSDDNISMSHIENIADHKLIHLDSLDEKNEASISNHLIEELNSTSDNNNFLSNISINDLGENEDLQSSKNEYKKLSLNKLREVVVSKGLTTDASKLKKNDILKLLGEE